MTLHRHLKNSLSVIKAPPIILFYHRLKHFNDICKSGTFPIIWQHATAIPIPIPDKDHSNPSNYRPIFLTSCICKTLKRMVNDGLV